MYRLAQDMAWYEKESAKYARPRGLAGLFSRPPRNPFPRRAEQRSLWYAQALFYQAYRGAFPDMVAYGAGPDGPEHKVAKMEVTINADGQLEGYKHEFNSRYFHDEHYEFRPGYGLRHAYSHSDDRAQDARNRNLAYARAMEERFADDAFFREFDRKADVLCDRLLEAEKRTYDARQMQSFVSDVEAYRRESEDERRRMDAIERDSRVKVGSVEEYAKEYVRIEALKISLMQGYAENTEALRTKFRARQASLQQYRYDFLSNELASRVEPVVRSDEDRLGYARWRFEMLTGGNPDSPENARPFVDSYIGFARRNGAGRDEILRDAMTFADSVGMPELRGELPHLVERSMEYADRKTVGDFEDLLKGMAARGDSEGKGVADIRYASLNDDLRMEFDRLTKADEAKRFLSKVDEVSAFGGNDPGSIAEFYFEVKNPKVSIESIADALVLERGRGLNDNESVQIAQKLTDRVDALRGKAFLDRKDTLKDVLDENGYLSARNAVRVGGWDGKRETVSSPTMLLANDMARAAFSLAEEKGTDKDVKLGTFLRENGIDVKGSGSLASAFRKAAWDMYGEGDAASAVSVAQFRARYADRIKPKAAPEAAATQARKVSRTNGPRL